MNKTLKTIAWICLALGLLGTAADAAAIAFGQNLISDRQAALGERLFARKLGKNSTKIKFCLAEDANNDGKPDGECLKGKIWEKTGARQPDFNDWTDRNKRFMDNRNEFNHGRMILPIGILLLFLFGLGPVLLVVGAVILIVNRQPKPAVDKKKKDVKKDTKAKK